MGLLDRQDAIVTGAGQGLGVVTALEFAHEGAAVALLERNPETVEAIRAQIEAVYAQFDRIDILVDSAD